MKNRGKQKGPPANRPKVAPAPAAPPRPITARPGKRQTARPPRSFWRSALRELPWLAALCAVTFLVWGSYADRLSANNWSVPAEYHGDALQTLAQIQAAAEGDYLPFHGEFIRRLGAPYSANWNDFPRHEKIPTYLLGVLARRYGLIEASNAGLLLAHLTAVLAFYLCCRWLKHRPEWSFAGALLFSFAYFLTFSSLGHLAFAITWTVPLAILSVWLVLFSRRLRPANGAGWFCLATAAVMGLSNPANLNMYVQLLLLALVIGWFINRRRENLIVGGLSLLLAAAGFLAINASTFAFEHTQSFNSAADPPKYSGSELNALKPMELMMPPANHRIGFLSDMGHWYRGMAWVHGEVFSPYLGVVGVAGLLWLGIEAAACVLRLSRRNLPPHALQCLWVIVYATVGGLNCLVVLGGVNISWVGNRFSIFILALALLFLVSRLSLLSRRWPRWASVAVAGAALVAGLLDEIPRSVTPTETKDLRAEVQVDRDFAAAMEAKMGSNAMVFQMPVTVYPEGKTAFHMDGDQHFRRYLLSKTLCFSFGSDRGRPREDWQMEMQHIPLRRMVQTLQRYGFAAIYLNRNGFTNDAEALLPELVDQLPGTDAERFFQDEKNGQVCIFLKPAPRPELPPNTNVMVTYARGWWPEMTRLGTPYHWTSGNGRLSFRNPGREPVTYNFSCELGSFDPRSVSLESAGKQLWQGKLRPLVTETVAVTILARPGNNFIDLKTPQPVFHPTNDPYHYYSIGLSDLKLTPQAAGKTNNPEAH